LKPPAGPKSRGYQPPPAAAPEEGYMDTARRVLGRITGYSTARQVGRQLRSRAR
jgi:hypothetical protein